MGADENFMREHWEWFKLRFSEPHEGYARGVYVVEIPMRKFSDKDESVALSLAAEFTRDRLEEIRQVEEEIRLLEGYNKSNKSCSENSFSELRYREQHSTSFITVRRTIVRLHAALAELKKGMK